MAKTAAKGAALKLGDAGSPEAFTTIAYLSTISFPGAKPDFIDTTSHDSASSYEEFVAGVIRTGEMTARGFFDSSHATHDPSTGFLSAVATLKNYQLVFADTGALQAAFAGILGYSLTADVAGANEFELTIRISGAITLS